MNTLLIKKIKCNGSEFILTSLAQCIYLFQNVIQNKIFTTCFETSVFGQWSLLVSVYTLVSMLPFSAIDQGIYKVAHKCKESGKEAELCTTISVFYVLGFIIYSLIFSLMSGVQKQNFFAYGYGIPFALYVFTEIFKNTLLLLDNAFRKRKRVLFIRIFGISSRTILFLLFYYFNKFSIESVLWILVWTNFIILIMENNYWKKITIRVDIKECKSIIFSILSFSMPLMTWAIFGWMQNMISRWYLNVMLDLESVAMYSVLTTLSYFAPNAVYTVFNAYVMPIVFERNKAFTRKKLLRYLGLVGMLMMLYWILILIFGKYLILVLADTKYLMMTRYLPFTTFTAILYVLSMLSTVEIYRRGETKKLLVSTILPGLCMATIGYFLIKYYGFIGAVVNYMSGHIIYTILTSMIVFNKKNIVICD